MSTGCKTCSSSSARLWVASPYWVMVPMSVLFAVLSLKPVYLPSWHLFFLICTAILTLIGTAIFSKVLLKDIFDKYFGLNNAQVRMKRDHDFAEL